MVVMKKADLEHHYSAKHKLDVLKGQACVDKVAAPQQSLSGHQAVLSKLQADQDKVMHSGFVVSELFAKKLKPHTNSEFVKECLFA